MNAKIVKLLKFFICVLIKINFSRRLEVEREKSESKYKLLPKNLRILQGDGVDLETIEKTLENFQNVKISAENLIFGSGGGLLQKFNRDTSKFAFKCSQVKVDGEEKDGLDKSVEKRKIKINCGRNENIRRRRRSFDFIFQKWRNENVSTF